jgi:ZIP family zinc transporter/zinc and cadmium transporter
MAITLLATGIAFLAFLGGGIISHRFAHFLAAHSSKVIAFASGAMLAITFVHVLPEAIALGGENAFFVVLAGILFFFTLEHFFYLHGCPDHASPHECKNHSIGPLAAIGIGIHSFFDGIIIVFSFLANPVLGWFTTLGIILHKLPAGAILHSLICQKKERKSLWWVFAVATATPLAALLSPLFTNLSPQHLGFGLAFSAGTLMYITLSDLIPETHQSKTRSNLIFLLLGMTLIFALNFFFSEHEHSHEDSQAKVHAEHFFE